jgi:hypothetical protein
MGETDMTGIAIGNRRMTGALGRTAAALLLVAAGAVAGIQVARLGGAGVPAHTTPLTADQLAADQGWQAFRAGERAGSSSLSGDSGYQAFRSGERGAGGSGSQLQLDGTREH